MVYWVSVGVGIGVDPAREADGVALDVAARPWVVVAEIIVMQVGRLVKELPRKAKLVGEGAQWGAVAERVRVPLPHRRAGTQKTVRPDSLTSTAPILDGAKSAAIP